MAPRSDSFDLAGLRLTTGEGRRFELGVEIGPFELGGERYRVEPVLIPVVLSVSKTTADGYALRVQFSASLAGPCMRCLSDAEPEFVVEAREVSQPGGGDELESPYVEAATLDLRGWARDALALAVPAQILCRPECAGLCSVCGADLNQTGPDHHHEREMDPRWSKLSELKFDA
jgi:uncharacterized protein